MTKYDYYVCDECGKELEPCECSPKQLMYTLLANYDTSGDLSGYGGTNQAHFCGDKCLKKYVNKKVEDHQDLPIKKKLNEE